MTVRLKALTIFSVLTLSALAAPGFATLIEIGFGLGTAPARGHPALPSLPESPGAVPKFAADAFYFMEEGFAGKEDMVDARGALIAGLLGQSPVANVARGRNGALYLRGSAMLDDRFARRPVDIDAVCAAVRDERERARATGADYLFLIGPNKVSVMPDDSPGWLQRRVGTARLDALAAACPGAAADVRPALIEAAAAARPYYRTDTHWNAYGAGAALAAALPGGPPAAPSPLRLERGGDLARMMGRRDAMTEESATLRPSGGPEAVCERSDGAPYQRDALDPVRAERIVCANPGAPNGTVVVVMDSFGVSLIPAVSRRYRRSVFLWREDVPWNVVEREAPDLVLRVLVERNVGVQGPGSAG